MPRPDTKKTRGRARLTRSGGRQKATTRPLPSKPISPARQRALPSPRRGEDQGEGAAAPPRPEVFIQAQGWTPHPFQQETWAAYASGESGLLHVPTGAGKTYAAYLAPLADVGSAKAPGLQILYVTPLRAVSRDIELALTLPLPSLAPMARVETRTGDTAGSVRARQRVHMPEVLVTTPESLSVLLSGEDAPSLFAGVRCTIVDEWHELLGTKRGTQTELALARLRTFAPGMRTWALSATLGNLEEAAQAAVGTGRPARILSAPLERPVVAETLLPDTVDSFPWAGHLGLPMLQKVVARLEGGPPTLLFTNTRSQAERWYQGLLFHRPEWAGHMALHHGSLDREERERVEAGLKSGSLRLVVCTSSLDLGVDFGPVEQVVQVGSPKGVGRLLQRAGRAGHRPGASCRILLVPTHALELVELAAAREALIARTVEARPPLAQPLDVLAQHLVTCALGGGFTREALLAEVRGAFAYRHLGDAEFEQTLALVKDGGTSLRAYPDYRRVVEEAGVFRVDSPRIARQHRLSIGTITSESQLQLQWVRGGKLGMVEEGYLSRLRPGEHFLFAGRALELVRLEGMKALVKSAPSAAQTPRWTGSRMALSPPLARAVRYLLQRAREGHLEGPELRAARPVLEAQARLSHIPGEGTLLAETCHTREGHHLFLYPFEGRQVHEGLGALLASRLSRLQRTTFSISVNEYGLELLAASPFPYFEALTPALFTTEGLAADIQQAVNLSELARRQFREVARVAGLVHPGWPGESKSARQVQASASLLYDVFSRYEPDSLLLAQARREVLEQHFQEARLEEVLRRLASLPLEAVETERPTPLGFPLVVERVSAQLSSESLLERVERLKRAYDGLTSRPA